MVLILVREDAGSSCVSGFVVRLQCLGRRCLLVRAGVFSRLSTGSSSHGHGGKLRFKIIHRQRDCSILWKFSSLPEHLSGEQPIDHSESSPSLVIYRDDEINSGKDIVGIAEGNDWHAYGSGLFDRLPVGSGISYQDDLWFCVVGLQRIRYESWHEPADYWNCACDLCELLNGSLAVESRRNGEHSSRIESAHEPGGDPDLLVGLADVENEQAVRADFEFVCYDVHRFDPCANVESGRKQLF